MPKSLIRKPMKVQVVKRRRPKRSLGSKIVSIPRFPPIRLKTNLTYREVGKLNAIAGALSYADFEIRTASVYDPLYSSTGYTSNGEATNQQPGWFDQIKTWYRALIVDKVYVDIEVGNKETTAACQVQLICGNHESQGSISNNDDWYTLRAPFYKSNLLEASGSNGDTKRYRFMIDNYKTCGASPSDVKLTQSNPLVTTPSASSPLGPLLQLKVKSNDANIATNCSLTCKIRYHCRFFDMSPAVGVDT